MVLIYRITMEHLKNLNEFNTNAHPEVHTNGSFLFSKNPVADSKDKGVNQLLGILSFDMLSKYITDFSSKNPSMKNKLKELIEKL